MEEVIDDDGGTNDSQKKVIEVKGNAVTRSSATRAKQNLVLALEGGNEIAIFSL